MSGEASQLDIFNLPSLLEGDDYEFKSARGGLPGSLWETYSAFANSHGGSIVLGVAEKENGSLDVQGVENVNKVLTNFWNQINDRHKISRNLLRREDVQTIDWDGRFKLIEIRVPRATRTERPVYVGLDPFRGTYRRNHEGDYRCTEAEVRRMFADQDPEQTVDSRILPGFTWKDLDPASIAQFRNVFRSTRLGHPWLSKDDEGLLEMLGGWRTDRITGETGLTMAGLLMFGRAEAITAPEGVPGFHLDYRERLSDDPNQRWSDRLTIDYTWEANLFQFYQRVILKLNSGPGIKQPFQIDAQGYRRAATPVHEALQEALVNALIHADHSGKGGIVIDRYPDRIELSNPGTLLVSREQLLRGGISECRNRSLQLMFQMLGIGDKAGSGIDKIRSSWKAQHWQSPSLKETYGPDRVRLDLPMASTLPEEIIQCLDERFGAAFRARNRDEVQALVAAEIDGEITNQQLQEMLSLHRVDITQMLRGLVRDGFLMQEGVGRGTRYYPIPSPRESQGSPPNLELALSRSDASYPDLSSSSLDLDANSQDLGSSSLDLDASSSDSDPSSLDLEGDRNPPSQDPELLALARPVREAGRAASSVVRRTILALCRDRFLSLRDLSTLLERKQESLRNAYLSPLVREGLIEPLYPDTPTHPNQAYRTRFEDETH